MSAAIWDRNLASDARLQRAISKLSSDDSDRKVTLGFIRRVTFDFSSGFIAYLFRFAAKKSTVSSRGQGKELAKQSFSDYQWTIVHPRSSYRSCLYLYIRSGERVGRVTRGETGKPDAQDLFGRQRSLWIKPPCTPTCGMERAACTHGLKAHGIKSWLERVERYPWLGVRP